MAHDVRRDVIDAAATTDEAVRENFSAQRRGCLDPAEAHRGRQDLGEGPQRNNCIAVYHRAKRRRRRTVVVKELVHLVRDDQKFVFIRQFDQPVATFERQALAARILVARNRV